MSDPKEYTYDDYLESGEVKPDPTLVAPETPPDTNLNEYTSGYTNEEIRNSLDSSAGDDLNRNS